MQKNPATKQGLKLRQALIYGLPMVGPKRIVITDRSALYFLLHKDCASLVDGGRLHRNPLDTGGAESEIASPCDFKHPLLGGVPIDLLLRNANDRRDSIQVKCHYTEADYPAGSFFELRPGLAMTTAELTFLRMSAYVEEIQLAEIGINLCARYYIDCESGDVKRRSDFITSPLAISSFCNRVGSVKGAAKAKRASRWLIANSGSPLETKTYLQFCLPLRKGGFALPLDCMNYSENADDLESIMEQTNFSIDLASKRKKIGLEYDGHDYHLDYWQDLRRRNELATLGWTIFPLNNDVLYNAENTLRMGFQLRKVFGLRNRLTSRWEACYRNLRKQLNLPL